jgi:hypothetical protein
LICGVLLGAVLAPSALAAGEVPVVERLVATNCEVKECGQEPAGERENPVTKEKEKYFVPKEKITVKEADEEGFTEAGGRVPFGITDFDVATIPGGKYSEGNVVPAAIVTHLRTDVAPGLSTNPFAQPRCTVASFGAEPIPGFFSAPGAECEDSKIGENNATVYGGPFGDLALSGIVYNLVPEAGEKVANGDRLASLYGVALKLPKAVTKAILEGEFAAHPLPLEKVPGGTTKEKEENKKPTEEFLEAGQYYAHTKILGNVEWGKEARGTGAGDYHDYFEVEVSPTLPLIRSRLTFFEDKAHSTGNFITNPTSCVGFPKTRVTITDAEKVTAANTFESPVELEGCNELEFEPEFALSSGNSLSDKPNELFAEATEEHEPKSTDVSQVKSASFTLPPGMTLNPAAAAGLEACSSAQGHQEGPITSKVFGEQFGVECPIGSKIGTVTLNTPNLPNGSLTGSVYLASETGTITNPPFFVYIVANSAEYGVSVRLLGETVPNPETGQLTTYIHEPPEQPFSSLSIAFERGVLTAIANPLLCGEEKGEASFEPTSAPGTHHLDPFGVSITGCAAATPPFALTQATEADTETAGAHTSFAFSLARADGNGYLKKITTSLPLGLVGNIPDVEPLCAEAQANAGTCPSSSKIGTVSVQAGSGSSPYTFTGTAYMTGPYNGAPYGMSIVVPANAGPFALGNVVTRAAIRINQSTAQVTAESELPTIYKGIPLRLRSINLNINRQGFLDNPTNCTTQATISTLTSTEGAIQSGLSSPFTVTGCANLKLAPKFGATTSAKVSRSTGTSLTTTLSTLPGESNIKSVKVTLPKQLPSRLTTLQKACLQATFEANPASCPAGSNVGTATVVTPTLPLPMQGKAYFVSHGGAAFPDLDLVLEEGLVKIILVGNTEIVNSITTTTFASTPDVPVTSVTVSLPAKTNSAVGGFGDLCRNPLYMPTVITGQNGKVTKLNPVISVSGCGVKVVGHKVIGRTAYLTIQTFAPGRISGSGKGVSTVTRSLSASSRAATLKIPLSRSGRGKRKPLKVKIRVGFVPKAKGAHSTATVTVTFR